MSAVMPPQVNLLAASARSEADAAAPERSAAAFLAEATSDLFWEAVAARRAAPSADHSLEIARQYRRERAQRAADELRS